MWNGPSHESRTRDYARKCHRQVSEGPLLQVTGLRFFGPAAIAGWTFFVSAQAHESMVIIDAAKVGAVLVADAKCDVEYKSVSLHSTLCNVGHVAHDFGVIISP